jgi:hypothetical protein
MARQGGQEVVKLIVCVTSCQRDWRLRGCHERIRKGYGANLPKNIELKFFIGGPQPAGLQDDEIWLDVPDGYLDLPTKVKAIFKYALECDYDHILKVDTDTVVNLAQVPDFEQFDYLGCTGQVVPANTERPKLGSSKWYAVGGGYFLSRKAAEIVVQHEPTAAMWAEDVWVGSLLYLGIVRGNIRVGELPLNNGFVSHQWTMGACKQCFRPVPFNVTMCGLHKEKHPADFTPLEVFVEVQRGGLHNSQILYTINGQPAPQGLTAGRQLLIVEPTKAQRLIAQGVARLVDEYEFCR